MEVISIDKIYNEFSSGKKDVSAIRDFVRMIYSRSSGSDSLKYLLLFGDASYDFKEFKVGGDMVPSYQSYESSSFITSYVSDDFYGLLEFNEGEWIEDRTDFSDLDIGIGRLPVNTFEEAESVVEKIINYGKVINDYYLLETDRCKSY